MKLKFLFLLLVVACTHIKKQERSLSEKDVPAQVLASFQQRHPGIETNFHEQNIEGHKSFEVHFEKDGKKLSERYDDSGKLIELEEEVSLDSIPPRIRVKIKDYLQANEATDIKKVQIVRGSNFIGHEVKAGSRKSKTGMYEYFFDKDGNFDHEEEVELKSIPNLN